MSTMTPETWADALIGYVNRLYGEGIPDTPANEQAIVAWENAEGGHWHNTAYYNPLNTTQPAPGATSMNSVGVKAYTGWDQGLRATAQTLENGYYEGILAALKQGSSAPAVKQAVVASPWGTKSISGVTASSSTSSGGGGAGVLGTVKNVGGAIAGLPGDALGFLQRLNPLDGISGAIRDAAAALFSWAARLGLSAAGVGLILLGLNRSLGVTDRVRSSIETAAKAAEAGAVVAA